MSDFLHLEKSSLGCVASFLLLRPAQNVRHFFSACFINAHQNGFKKKILGFGIDLMLFLAVCVCVCVVCECEKSWFWHFCSLQCVCVV